MHDDEKIEKYIARMKAMVCELKHIGELYPNWRNGYGVCNHQLNNSHQFQFAVGSLLEL